MADYSKKCKTCPKFDSNKSKSLKLKEMWCSHHNDWCENHYIDCEYDKRKICGLCKKYGIKECGCCAEDGHFKNESIPRICNSFIKKEERNE